MQLEVAFVEAIVASAVKAQEMGKVLGFRIKRDLAEPIGDRYVFLLFHKRIVLQIVSEEFREFADSLIHIFWDIIGLDVGRPRDEEEFLVL